MKHFGFYIFMFILGCATAQPGIFDWIKGKPPYLIYVIKPDKGLVRDNGKEIRSFQDSEGYLCFKPNDLQSFIAACRVNRK